MKVTDNCYMVSGLCAESPWAVNAGFVVGEHTTMVVDTGTSYFAAQTIFGYACCAGPGNKMVVVNTEPHFDHIGGNSFFRGKQIDIFSHPDLKRTAQEFQNNKDDLDETIVNRVRKRAKESKAFYYGTEPTNPNRFLRQGDVVELGGVDGVVYETPGHTPQNISLFIPEEGVLYCGDAVVTGYIPNLECGGVDAWRTWLASIDVLAGLEPQVIVPGHGHEVSGVKAVNGALDGMRAVLGKAIDVGTAPTLLGG